MVKKITSSPVLRNYFCVNGCTYIVECKQKALWFYQIKIYHVNFVIRRARDLSTLSHSFWFVINLKIVSNMKLLFYTACPCLPREYILFTIIEVYKYVICIPTYWKNDALFSFFWEMKSTNRHTNFFQASEF